MKHILVTDDEDHTLLALRLTLRKAGFNVTTLNDGPQTVDRIIELIAASEPIDLLVIDIEMPGMTGMEVIETIARMKIILPILVISGYEARGVLAERLRIGCVWFLEKPFEPKTFVDTVNHVIEQAAWLRQDRNRQST